METLKENISEWVSASDKQQDPSVNWEFLKHKIFRFSKQYANEQAEKRKAKRVSLEDKVQQLEKQIVDSEVTSKSLISEYENTKKELERIYDYITSEIIFRSKVKWYEEGEENTQYFFSLEKRNKTKSQIRKLIGQNDDEITGPKSMFNEIKSFCSNLYSRRSDKTEQECFQYLASINVPKLSESEREDCEGRLTLQKCWETLQSMKNGKSPGNHGLTKEFYVCF